MKFAALALAVAFAALGPSFTPVEAQTQPKLPANITWRDPDLENTLVVETSKGTIISELYPLAAPIAVQRIKSLTRQKFYDGLEFFRVIKGFMDQTGDPQNSGAGGSMLANIPAEFSFRRGPDVKVTPITSDKPNTAFIGVLPVTGQPNAIMAISADGKAQTSALFCPGVLGIARGGDPDSANSQFFFMRATSAVLNTKYTAFGRVIQGMDAVRSIKAGEPVPQPRDTMSRVRLLADIPIAERPKVQVMDTSTPAFAAYVDTLRVKAGAYFDICDIDTTTPLN